eukprot:3579899-Amphidinium_carterae.1
MPSQKWQKMQTEARDDSEEKGTRLLRCDEQPNGSKYLQTNGCQARLHHPGAPNRGSHIYSG